LDEYSCVLIKRNREWFQSVLPQITKIWGIIELERITGFAHRAPKKRPPATLPLRTSSSLVCDIEIDNIILPTTKKNSTNKICIIKMDENGNVL